MLATLLCPTYHELDGRAPAKPTSNTSLSQLRFICAAVQAGSVRRAAKARRVSQPTLSVQVQQLDEELGIQIFDRLTQPLTVTAEGQKIIEEATVARYELKKLRSLVRIHNRHLQTRVRG